MNVGKLKRVAIKEFKRSPAKSGILLAALPVALYFCVPLLFGALKKSSPPTGEHVAAVVLEQADFVLPAATKAEAPPSQVGPSWIEAARSLENDLLAVPTGIPADARNPFAKFAQDTKEEPSPAAEDGEQVVMQETEEESEESVGGDILPSNPIRDLGLQLTATMVGRRSRLATINGKTYGEGETIPVIIETGTTADSEITVPLELVRVDRRSVVLTMDGQEHCLELPNEISQDAIVVKSRAE